MSYTNTCESAFQWWVDKLDYGYNRYGDTYRPNWFSITTCSIMAEAWGIDWDLINKFKWAENNGFTVLVWDVEENTFRDISDCEEEVNGGDVDEMYVICLDQESPRTIEPRIEDLEDLIGERLAVLNYKLSKRNNRQTPEIIRISKEIVCKKHLLDQMKEYYEKNVVESRIKYRAQKIKEELMKVVWHPDRVAAWLEAGLEME